MSMIFRHVYAFVGHAQLISTLLRYGVPIDSKNSLGETALHLAAYSGKLLITEQLIDKGANIDAVNNDNETPLFYAARCKMYHWSSFYFILTHPSYYSSSS